MTISILFAVLFLAVGLCTSEAVFSKHTLSRRIWLGLVLGLLMLTWYPSFFSFFVGFNVTSHILAVVLALATAGAAIFYIIWQTKHGKREKPSFRFQPTFLFVVVPLFILGAGLFSTHIIKPHADGSLWVGQVTYGDLAMHLGFITSIAEQGVFPPQYSIYTGHAVNYPFLCETSSSSLYLLGADLRTAYLIPALWAYLVVLLGVYFFFEQWLKRKPRALIATLLFFLGSGFGFAYFFDLAQNGSALSTYLNAAGQSVGTNSTNAQLIWDGFYRTPTNLPTIGLRWVNPIVDMLVPQRATLFGWAFLFPCLYLLQGFTFHKMKENILPLAVMAGLLPLIHTHSFLALGIISAAYCIGDLLFHFDKKRALSWLIYAGIACLLAAPQLFKFSFQQAAESSMVQFHLNWANNADSYLWFYIKNLGMVFLLMPIAFFTLSKRDRRIFSGALLVWLIAELFVFQPNEYDNNKLLFVWYAYLCGLAAKFLGMMYHRVVCYVRKRSTTSQRANALTITSSVLLGILFLYQAYRASLEGAFTVPYYVCWTLLLLNGLCLYLQLYTLWMTRKDSRLLAFRALQMPAPIVAIIGISVTFYRQYTATTVTFSDALVTWMFLTLILALLTSFCALLWQKRTKGKTFFAAGSLVALQVTAFALAFVMTIGASLTIAREYKSEYQVYTAQDVKMAEFIRDNTDAEGTVLSHTYHWNLVTPLSGHSIVTGTGLYLYYHGINTSEREAQVKQMFESPTACAALFAAYNVRYVVIDNGARSNYTVDTTYFTEQCTLLFDSGSAQLYELP